MPNVSKIYEKCLLSQYQIILKSSFRNFNVVLDKVSAQYCVISMIEKWIKSVDEEKTFATLLTDLSKLLIVSHLTLSLLNLTLMDLVYQLQSKWKCYLLTSSSDKVSICVDNYNIKCRKCEKLLGIKIDNKLNFNTHVDEICKKAGQKLNALSRVSPYMDLSKRCILLNAFFILQFSYCPLMWMFHSRRKNTEINRIHERCLRIIYNKKRYAL